MKPLSSNLPTPRRWAAALLFAAAGLTGCGSDGDGDASLSGTAAVGKPIVGGTVNVSCSSGNPLSTTTNSSGAWRAALSGGQTPPCKLQVSGGTVDGTALPEDTAYHSVAVDTGTANITPLTDLVVANLTGQNPATWYASVSPADLGKITAAAVTTAVGNVRTALNVPAFGSAVDPITTTLVIGDEVDKVLDALRVAVPTAPDYAALLTAAQGQDFATTFPVSYGTALNNALAGAGSGGGGTGGGGTGGGDTGGAGSITAPLTPASTYVVAYTGSLCKDRSDTRNCDIGLDLRTAAVTLSSRGEMTGYADSSRPEEAPTLGTAVVSELGGNADLSWGRWNGGTPGGKFYTLDYANSSLQAANGFHYVVGNGSTSLPASGTATYTAVSATGPTATTAFSSAEVANVDLVASKVKVDFGSRKVGFDVTYKFGSGVDVQTFQLRTTNGVGDVAGSQFAFGDEFTPIKAVYLVNPSAPLEFFENGAPAGQFNNDAYLVAYGTDAAYLALVFHDRFTISGVVIFKKDTAGGGTGGGGTGGGSTNPLLTAAGCSAGITTGYSLVAEVTVAGVVSTPICVDGLSSKPSTQTEFCGSSEFRQGLPPGFTLNSCSYDPSSGVANVTASFSPAAGVPAVNYAVKYTFVPRS